jgi:hypothetical protein
MTQKKKQGNIQLQQFGWISYVRDLIAYEKEAYVRPVCPVAAGHRAFVNFICYILPTDAYVDDLRSWHPCLEVDQRSLHQKTE